MLDQPTGWLEDETDLQLSGQIVDIMNHPRAYSKHLRNAILAEAAIRLSNKHAAEAR